MHQISSTRLFYLFLLKLLNVVITQAMSLVKL